MANTTLLGPVLGINGCQDTFHDASSTVISNGRVSASVEEERYNRIKHSRGLPWMSCREALAIGGVNKSDLAAVGYYLDPYKLFDHYFLNTVQDHWPDSFGLFQAAPFYLDFLRSREYIRKALELPRSVPIYFVRHHFCHAASTYYASPFEDAAVLVVDGSGECETSSYYLGQGNSLSQIGSPMRYPSSVGFFYEGVASHLGLGWIGGAGKLMGLAPFGQPTKFDALMSWFNLKDDGSVDVDLSKMTYYLNKAFFTEAALAELGPGRKENDAILTEHADLAASAQKVLEELVVHMAKCLQRRTGASRLCYSGGVALNIDANTEILNRAGFKDVYIMPAAYDGGTSLGAAYAVYFKTFPKAERPQALLRADHGGSHTDEEVEAALKQAGLSYEKLGTDELVDKVARRLASGAVAGWYTGRMEYGPRALGFRSILASPEKKEMADYLNTVVKGREPYRPFAPAVTLRAANDFFDVCAPSPFMLYKFGVRDAYRHKLGAVTHVDGSARAQTVTKEENDRFHSLLERFGALYGVPVLLNTSFNLGGEPLVETPAQAIDSYKRSGMDLLVLNNLLVDPGQRPGFDKFEGLDPCPQGVIMLAREPKVKKPSEDPKRWELEQTSWQTWMTKSIDQKSAAAFFKPWYSLMRLAVLRQLVRLCALADRRIIRDLPRN